jgi:hypothetical protein
MVTTSQALQGCMTSTLAVWKCQDRPDEVTQDWGKDCATGGTSNIHRETPASTPTSFHQTLRLIRSNDWRLKLQLWKGWRLSWYNYRLSKESKVNAIPATLNSKSNNFKVNNRQTAWKHEPSLLPLWMAGTMPPWGGSSWIKMTWGRQYRKWRLHNTLNENDISDCSHVYKHYWAQWNFMVMTDSMLEHHWQSADRRGKTDHTVLPRSKQ